MLKHTDTILKTAVFESIQGKRVELRRHIAILILRDLVKSCPKVLAPYQLDCLDNIGVLISDPSVGGGLQVLAPLTSVQSEIKELAAQTLGFVLDFMHAPSPLLDIEERKAIYESLFQLAEQAVSQRWNQSADTFLLIARELALHADGFLIPHLESVFKVVLEQLKNPDFHLKALGFQLLPVLADLDTESFRRFQMFDRAFPGLLSGLGSSQSCVVGKP
jgi:hypothetical protein